MNVASMRAVDRWLGVPVCAALSLVARFTRHSRPAAVRPPRRLLFVKLAEQGSTVLAHAAISRAVELVGAENVYFLCFEENRFILDTMDLIPAGNIITVRHSSLLAACVDGVGLVRRLRRCGFEVAIDLEFFARATAAITFLCGARVRVGFHNFGGAGPYRGNLMTHPLIFTPHLHTTETFLSMVEASQVPPTDLPHFVYVPPETAAEMPQFRPAAEEVEAVDRILRGHCGDRQRRPLVLLNANCGDLLPLRRWPEQRYCGLAEKLLGRFPDLHVAFTGAPDEQAATEALAAGVGADRCFSVAGQTSLRQLMTLYSNADVLVTNDSGPAHFAALTEIDVITLFGPEHPKLFGARGPRSHIFWEGIDCSPCVNAYNNRTSPCRNNVCLQGIEVDRVFDKVCEVLARRR
jgi:ADP-heptose:LPS heptosyltransferase